MFLMKLPFYMVAKLHPARGAFFVFIKVTFLKKNSQEKSACLKEHPHVGRVLDLNPLSA